MFASATSDQARGRIVKSFADGRPVIWNFVDELPGEAVLSVRPKMVAIRWTYEAVLQDSFPDETTQAAIYRLDARLGPLEDAQIGYRAYVRTGSGLREWVYYTADHGQFMAALNDALADHEVYPIDIRFYEDPGWSDFRQLLVDFGLAGSA